MTVTPRPSKRSWLSTGAIVSMAPFWTCALTCSQSTVGAETLTPILCAFTRGLGVFRGGQQGLGRYAAIVQAITAHFMLFIEDHVQTRALPHQPPQTGRLIRRR